LTQIIFPQPFLPQDAGRTISMDALWDSLGLQAK
jgi:hypothetical protein